MHMYVSGIDCSVTAAGVAVAPIRDGARIGFTTHIVGVTGVQSMPLPVLIATLDDLAEKIVRLACPVELVSQDNPYPALVVIEAPTAGKLVSGGLFERGYLYYTVIKSLMMRSVRVVVANNSHVKQYVTGKGNATKGAVIDAIGRRLPMFETSGEDGRADAAACAALAAAIHGNPLVKMPAPHWAAVEAVLNGPTRRKRSPRTKAAVDA